MYEEQVVEVERLLVQQIEGSSSKIDVEKYLKICEELGEEPDPERMPPDASVFPLEVQVAFFVYNHLSDRYEGMSGTYLGKEWGPCFKLFELFEVEDTVVTHFFMKMIERLTITHSAKLAEKDRKQRERKNNAAGGGKSFTHNVRG